MTAATEAELVPLPTHYIVRGKLDRNALLAQVDALEGGISLLRQFLTSDPFTSLGELSGYVHNSQVLVRLSEALSSGTEARKAIYAAAQVPNCERSGTPIEQYNPNALGDDYRCPGCRRWLGAAVTVPPFWPDHARTEEAEEARAAALGRAPALGAETQAARFAALVERRTAPAAEQAA